MAQLEIHQRTELNKAAQEDVYMLDLTTVAEGASDSVHGLIGSTLKLAQKRFDAHLAGIPADLMDAALEYVCDRGDEIMLARLVKAKRKKAAFAAMA
jgi:hypothetical protein